MAQMTMIQAITDAMRVEMKRDEKVLLFGEDVGKNGGVFRATEGLQDEFGEDRVFDTPLAESGIGGLAIGLGLTGFRPIMEVQFFGFVFEVSTQSQLKWHVCVTVQAALTTNQSQSVHHSVVELRHLSFMRTALKV